jgi:hypothetical protein
MLHGQMQIASNYVWQKQLHAILQTHFFMGAFIIGFCLQITPRLFEVRLAPPQVGRYVIVGLVSSAILVLLENRVGPILLSFCFLFTIGALLPHLRISSREIKVRVGYPLFIGLLSLAAGAMLDTGDPVIGLMVFWCGVVPIVYASGQQLLSGMLGFSSLSGSEAKTMLSVYVLSVAALVTHFGGSPFQGWSWLLFAMFATATVSFAIFCLRSAGFGFRLGGDAVAFAVTSGSFWTLLGALALFAGAQYSDAVLHIWATGLVMPLIFSISSRVVGAMSGKGLLSEKVFLWLLWFWQLVPLGRGVGRLITLPATFAWVVGFTASIVYLVWLVQILRRSRTIYRKFAEMGA